ncbi:MAG: hypothetical protein WA118_05580 [Carboxydocellales bacterium]
MALDHNLPLRKMLTELTTQFRVDRCRPALAFALLRGVKVFSELVVVANNLIPLHDQVTSPYHFYEVWFEQPLTKTAISTGAFNTDPQGKGIHIFRFNPIDIGGHPLAYYSNIYISAEPQDGDAAPATRVLG